ncbi:MAG: aminotransferase class I/II-fold pyridoxal phosphate-dependent enzyme [Clostridiales Family XIII bacterium]|jgi:histidinol-phosphate aminotransferase|nr:aminotransferase class I/II-fold pyridoxal phosphate-dependent enzyme [Clostridiales Family XIII bacterium]
MGGWRDNLIDIEPYAPGEQIRVPGLIKLNTNENPFPPSPAAASAAGSFDAKSLMRYPDPDAGELVGILAAKAGVSEDMVVAGNGSDEILAFAFRAFFNSSRPVLFPDVTYSFYPVWCRLFGISYEEIPLRDDFHMYAADYERENGGVVIANPNAPTGIAEGLGFFRNLLDANPDSIVIVDEAYVDFGADSALTLIGEYDNLFVARTFSKSRSLAGLRLGFGYGHADLVVSVNAVKNSFNSYAVDSFAMAVGAEAARDDRYYRERTAELVRVRDSFTESMRGLGFIVYDSSANFVFVSHPGVDAGDMYGWLKGRDILVRWFDKPRIRDHLRITIGLAEEMDALFTAISTYMKEKNIR